MVPGLQQSAAPGAARVPQHGERGHARGELPPPGARLPRAGRLRAGLPVLLPGHAVRAAQLRAAALRAGADVHLQRGHGERESTFLFKSSLHTGVIFPHVNVTY